MSRIAALRKQMPCLPTALPLACGIALLALPPLGSAQGSTKAAPAGGASGAIIVPPATDPGMAKQVPPSGDKQAVKPPPMQVEPDAVRKAAPGKDAAKMKEGASTPPAPRKVAPGFASGPGSPPSSMQDDCKGNAASCKPDSTR